MRLCGLRDRRRRDARQRIDPHRGGLGWPAGGSLVPSYFKGQTQPVGITDVDALAVVNVDQRCSLTVDESTVPRAVVDRHPPALIETQQQMRAGDQGMRDTHIGAEVTSNDHIMACREAPF